MRDIVINDVARSKRLYAESDSDSNTAMIRVAHDNGSFLEGHAIKLTKAKVRRLCAWLDKWLEEQTK